MIEAKLTLKLYANDELIATSSDRELWISTLGSMQHRSLMQIVEDIKKEKEATPKDSPPNGEGE